MDERSAATDWERRRDYESQREGESLYIHEDSFHDTGSAKAYFTRNRNRERISMSLRGEEGRHHDDEEESVE